MAKKRSKALTNVIRLGICAAALWFVLRGVKLDDRIELGRGEALAGTVTEVDDGFSIRFADGSTRHVPLCDAAVDRDGKPRIEYGLRTAWRNSRGWFLLIAIAAYFPTALLQGVRLRWLLLAQRISLGHWECIKLSLAGNFLNFATPLGSNAGDVFKAVFLTGHTDRKTEAAATIVLDRVIGLGTMLLSAGAITVFCSAEGPLAALRPYVLTVIGIGIVAVLAYLSPFVRPAFRAVAPAAWLETPRVSAVFTHVLRIDRAARGLVRRRTIVLGAILITVVLQSMGLTGYFAVAGALQLDAHLGNMLEYYAYFYTGLVIQALPGPPQGLGTVELAYRYFFAPFGSVSQIICMAFMIRVVVLVCSLPGLLVTLTGSYKPRDVPARARATMVADAP